MMSKAVARARRVEAVDLVRRGLSYDEVAKAVGYSHRGSAHRAVQKALAEHEAQSVEELRAVEGARLDALQAALWPRAQAGHIPSVLSVCKVIDQRSRLLGLYGVEPKASEVDALVRPREGNPGQATEA